MKTAEVVAKVFIIAFAIIRLYQAFKHLTLYNLTHDTMFSSATALSFTVAVCSLILLVGTIGDFQVMLEIWMVWTVLQFGAVIFSVFDLSFENNTFFRQSLLINITISSILQVITLIMVLKLHKWLSTAEAEFLSETIDGTTTKSHQNILNVESQDAVAFEPCLFSNLMLGH